MPLPDFNNDEQYLIGCLKSSKASRTSNSYMWGYIIGSALIAGFAAYYENVWMMLAAFVIVCSFRVYEERLQSRWMPYWQSIIEKYEAAATDADQAAVSDLDQDGKP